MHMAKAHGLSLGKPFATSWNCPGILHIINLFIKFFFFSLVLQDNKVRYFPVSKFDIENVQFISLMHNIRKL